jgi:hypothetical protein
MAFGGMAVGTPDVEIERRARIYQSVPVASKGWAIYITAYERKRLEGGLFENRNAKESSFEKSCS